MYLKKKKKKEIPWWSRDYDFVLSLLSTWVRSLVRELRSHQMHNTGRRKKKKEAIFKNWLNTEVKAERSSLETERKGEEKLSRWGKRFSGHKKPQLRR